MLTSWVVNLIATSVSSRKKWAISDIMGHSLRWAWETPKTNQRMWSSTNHEKPWPRSKPKAPRNQGGSTKIWNHPKRIFLAGTNPQEAKDHLNLRIPGEEEPTLPIKGRRRCQSKMPRSTAGNQWTVTSPKLQLRITTTIWALIRPTVRTMSRSSILQRKQINLNPVKCNQVNKGLRK